MTTKNVETSQYFHVGMALFMTVIVFLGFWPSYFGPILFGQGFEGHWIIHIHATIFLGWMVVLITQTSLVARNKTPTHMKVGRYGFALGILVLLMGLTITFRSYQQMVSEGTATPFTFLWAPLVDMIEFSTLLVIGFTYRSRPEIHKRMMLFATVAILHAATGVRMDYLLGAWTTEIMFAILVALIYGHDLYTKGRVHRASLIGTLIVLPDITIPYLIG